MLSRANEFSSDPLAKSLARYALRWAESERGRHPSPGSSTRTSASARPANYGLGLEQYANDAVTVIGHMGTGEAQSAFLGYDTEHGTAVAVMTNAAVPGPQAIMAVETLIAVNDAG